MVDMPANCQSEAEEKNTKENRYYDREFERCLAFLIYFLLKNAKIIQRLGPPLA